MTDFTRFVTGDPRAMFSSELNATFTRPLLRDAGFQQEKEALVQSERRLLYDLRDFTRFRKNLSVQIATAYYGVLRNRDTARNSYLNLQSSRKNAERSRALAKEGRITQSDLGRLEQQELSTEGTWIDSIRNYKLALDNFKRQLGVNVDTQVVLDDRDLQNLQILDPNLRLEDSVRIALSARLDYLTLKDELEDTERKVKLAANALLPQIDLTGFAAIDSNPNDNRGFPLPNPKRYSYSGGLTIDPGLDRKSQRNDYRNALINRDQAARNIADKEDEITVQVNDSWRTLDQAKRTYEISEIGVKLAERRVEEQNLLAELGRAKAQDQVDAQNALIDSKNQLTAALVNHTVARLQLWENVEVLYIKDNGQWEEIQHAKAQ
jgi:outer membrane protein TolC